VPAHAELHLLLSMITPQGWLERAPLNTAIRPQVKSANYTRGKPDDDVSWIRDFGPRSILETNVARPY
jgi:hypothetical protein